MATHSSTLAQKILWTEEPGAGYCPWGHKESDMTERFHVTSRPWQPTPVLLPGKSHEERGLVGYSPWGCKELDITERLHFHFSLSCIGAGNGNPLQYSCLENPRDRGAWWTAVYGVTQSRTRLKRLSSSSSSCNEHGGTRISFNPGFLSVYAQQWIAGSYGSSILSF